MIDCPQLRQTILLVPASLHADSHQPAFVQKLLQTVCNGAPGDIQTIGNLACAARLIPCDEGDYAIASHATRRLSFASTKLKREHGDGIPNDLVSLLISWQVDKKISKLNGRVLSPAGIWPIKMYRFKTRTATAAGSIYHISKNRKYLS